MRIAFSTLACPDWTVEEIADAARRYAYDAIEWRLADGALLGRKTDPDVWRRIANAGVPAVCLDTSCVFVQPGDIARQKAIDIATAMGERASEIGAPFIRVFAGALPESMTRSRVAGPTRDALAAAAERMPDGVRILVETHDAWTSAKDISRLVSTDVGVVWDVAHTVRAGEHVEDTLAVIGTPGLVHVKDASGEQLTHLGDGEIPLAAAVEALRARSYDGFISLEWEKLWHPYLDDADVALPRAMSFLRAL